MPTLEQTCVLLGKASVLLEDFERGRGNVAINKRLTREWLKEFEALFHPEA